jgi:hypothetical protein
MKRSATGSVLSLVAALLVAGAPLVAHACPMCFASGENNDAFLYGSIFLMVVPVASLGGLAYWAYRRLKAIDDGVISPDVDGQNAAQKSNATGVLLKISERR